MSATLLGSLLFRILEHITHSIQLGFAGGDGTIYMQQLSALCIYAVVSATFIVRGWSVVSIAAECSENSDERSEVFRSVQKQSSNCD